MTVEKAVDKLKILWIAILMAGPGFEDDDIAGMQLLSARDSDVFAGSGFDEDNFVKNMLMGICLVLKKTKDEDMEIIFGPCDA